MGSGFLARGQESRPVAPVFCRKRQKGSKAAFLPVPHWSAAGPLALITAGFGTFRAGTARNVPFRHIPVPLTPRGKNRDTLLETPSRYKHTRGYGKYVIKDRFHLLEVQTPRGGVYPTINTKGWPGIIPQGWAFGQKPGFAGFLTKTRCFPKNPALPGSPLVTGGEGSEKRVQKGAKSSKISKNG